MRDRLAEAGIDARIIVLPDSARTAALAAQAIGCPVGAIANSLVLVEQIGAERVAMPHRRSCASAPAR